MKKMAEEIKEILKDINFEAENEKLVDMFGDIADKISKKLNDRDRKKESGYREDISSTQFRKFYDKVLELNDKAQGLSDKDFKVKILPFLKMLNSKVQYSETRGHSGKNFVELMKTSIDRINEEDGAKKLQNFKYFLESIIGFMPKK